MAASLATDGRHRGPPDRDEGAGLRGRELRTMAGHHAVASMTASSERGPHTTASSFAMAPKQSTCQDGRQTSRPPTISHPSSGGR